MVEPLVLPALVPSTDQTISTGQRQRQDQGIKTRSFRLQKGSTPVLVRFCYS